MKTQYSHLHGEQFAKVKQGKKTIESRVNDAKRRTFSVGDTLIFCNRENGEELHSKIIGLHSYATFAELFASHPVAVFGGTSLSGLLQEVQQFYSEEEEKEWGIVGIEFCLKQ